MSRFIILDSNNKVVAVRNGLSIVTGEIESYDAEIGQIMQVDGTFITPEPVPTEPIETVEQKLERLELQRQSDNLTQFDVLATIYEELLLKS